LSQSATAPSIGRVAPALVLVLVAVAAVYFVPSTGGPLHALRLAAVWLFLMVVPGASLFRLLDSSRQGLLEVLLAGVVASPLVVTLVATGILFAGGSPHAASLAVVVASAGLLLAAALVRRPTPAAMRSRDAAVLACFIAGLLLLTSTLPFTREWWRIRSDAWFHAAVVAQIRDFGLPPEDPYFLGLRLQYMWFYHVLLTTLADALRVGPFGAMAMFNAHAVVALVLAGYQFASALRARFLHRFVAAATLVLAFNAAFWIFLPVKLVKAFMGDVRGMDEVRRTLALTPLHYDTASRFLNIYFNQEFFLDKFMVATAFGIALVFMTSAWAGAIDYLQNGRRYGLALVATSVVGMLGFHSLVGFVFLVGVVGGASLLHATRARIESYQPRRPLVLVAVCVLCLLAVSPYLYQVSKESEQAFPLDFSFRKMAGIFISCAFVLVLAIRARSFWSDRSMGARFLAWSAAAVAAFCLSIALPGANTYDKLGYFVFIPCSIVAGFAIADSVAAKAGRARIITAAAWVLLFFVPVNAIAFVSCFGTPDAVVVTPAEWRLSEWVRANTTRDAVFIDDHDRAPLLVTGPRRYLFGSTPYAEQWGYPLPEMTRRRHAVEALYRPWPAEGAELDALSGAFEALGAIEEPLFAVVRPEHRTIASVITVLPFVVVFQDPEISLVRIDRDTCRRYAAHTYN